MKFVKIIKILKKQSSCWILQQIDYLLKWKTFELIHDENANSATTNPKKLDYDKTGKVCSLIIRVIESTKKEWTGF